VDRAGLKSGETVLVIGAGPIGLSVMQFAGAAGCRIIALDVNEERLAFARSAMRVEETVMAGEAALETVSELTGGDLPTAVFDATGSADSMKGSFEYVAHGGRLIFVGLFQGDVTFHDPFFHRREMTLLSSRNSTAQDFRRIIAMMEAGEIDTAPWITHRAQLSDLAACFPTWLDPANRVLKAIVDVE
jgi:2-desacetyl-2-hydroxyethyl bacteriochlorophyllide A dehydrogenase